MKPPSGLSGASAQGVGAEETSVSLLARLEAESALTPEDLEQLRRGLRRFQGGGDGDVSEESDSLRKRGRHGDGDEEDSVDRGEACEEGRPTENPASAKRSLKAMPGGFLRAVADYEDRGSDRFVVRTRKYQQQYSAVYYSRLAALSGTLFKQAENRWPGLCIHPCIRDMQTGQECVIVGTLFKDMVLKPSVLKEYLDDIQVQATPNSFLSDSDALFLEDQTARVRLVVDAASSSSAEENGETAEETDALADAGEQLEKQKLRVNGVVTGLVVAVRGVATDNGRFLVRDFCLGGAPAFPPLSRPLRPETPARADKPQGRESALANVDLDSKFVAFVSDLRIGDANGDPASLQLLRDFLLGAFGGSFECQLASRVVRLVIAGNALAAVQRPPSASSSASSPSKPGAGANASLKATLQEADVFLSQLAASVPVDLMPGDADPTTFSLPQQPLHGALLPISRTYGSIRAVSNPHAFALDQIRFIGSAGQPVSNVCAFSDLRPLEALRLCTEARCLAPTAPDSLSLYPFVKDDPCCIAPPDYHHVYFSGNHDSLSFERMTRTGGEEQADGQMDVDSDQDKEGPLLLCIPSFAKTKTLVLVDLQSLSVHPVHLVVAAEEN
ncbi:DNA polymerase epsilon subunit B protein [Toxoplasma gondii VAND]|uniref:DNA polymerase epsilon subunit B protein n=1 Tax=Toxoplasma gondii VAND TaxID=933077 RepID=A0A086QFS1_TOXGO|nr:DNA polymerase epsilon subunit B protein [Toxoplasma gondii VAND]